VLDPYFPVAKSTCHAAPFFKEALPGEAKMISTIKARHRNGSITLLYLLKPFDQRIPDGKEELVNHGFLGIFLSQ
jgi:hypothetical protein